VFTGPQSPTPLIIVVVVLLLFGAKRIPELARDLGAGVREFKKGAGSEGETELEEAFDPHEERKTPLASSHAGLIHPSAWKWNPLNSICRIVHRTSSQSHKELAPRRIRAC
jgi:TatA/E family protein of Tat protein translocase